MSAPDANALILHALERAEAALTYDYIEQRGPDFGAVRIDNAVPLLDRSISRDLRNLEAQFGNAVRGKTLLSANAAAIDEALLAIAEARQALEAGR